MNQERKELNKRIKPKGMTRKITCQYTRNIYFIDLIDFSSKVESFVQDCIDDNPDIKDLRKLNNGYNYVLVCVDGYSRYTMVKLMNTKKSKEVIHNFKQIIHQYGKPNHIFCDLGGEFKGDFKEEMDRLNIKVYHGHSESKAVLAERAIKSIKELIRTDFIDSNGCWYKYIDSAVDIINNRINSSTGYTPTDIFVNNKVYDEFYNPPSNSMSDRDKTPVFKVGDHVRIAQPATSLQKRSLTYRWSTRVYKVDGIDTSALPIMYSLDGSNKKYYHWQLLESKCPIGEPVPETHVEEPESKHEYNTRHKRYDYSRYA